MREASMAQPAVFAAIVLFISSWPAPVGSNLDNLAATDANLVTALDVSDSITRHDEWLEFDGMARAVVDPRFLEVVFSGRHGRIGFAVYIWSSHGNFRVVVPWMLIASVDDAERVAGLLRDAPRIDRSHYGGGDNAQDDDARQVPSFETDISAALRFGLDLLASAPKPTERAVINVCGNGIDNVGGNPKQTRDLAMASGVTVNGLVLGDRTDLADYYRDHVTGGPGSFVMHVRRPEAVTEAMVTKLLRDLVALREDAPGPALAPRG
jgi:Ca-activated chloride channel family protein